MTLEQLIEELQELLQDGVPPETEVRFASQPSWPMEHSLNSHVFTTGEDEDGQEVVYLSEQSKLGYLPTEVKDYLNW